MPPPKQAQAKHEPGWPSQCPSLLATDGRVATKRSGGGKPSGGPGDGHTAHDRTNRGSREPGGGTGTYSGTTGRTRTGGRDSTSLALLTDRFDRDGAHELPGAAGRVCAGDG